MRMLYILQGMPGSGKSSFIKSNHLQPYTLNLDEIRNMFDTPTYFLDDLHQTRGFVDQTNHKEVMNTFYNMLFNRFKKQETTIIDATNLKPKNLNEIIAFSKHFMYEYKIVRIGEDLSLSELLYRNKSRGIYSIPDEKLTSMYESYKQIRLLDTENVINSHEMLDDLRVTATDITDQYQDFQVIGDVHSSASTLKELLKNFSNKRLYIFCGDYFDRGTEHYETLLFLESLMKKENVVFLTGNHDVHLYNYILSSTKKVLGNDKYDVSITGKDFKADTLKIFEKNKVSIKRIKDFFSKLQDVFYFKFHEKTFLVSHAGLNNQQVDMIDRFKLMDSDFFIKGVGNYSYDIDKEYQANWNNNDYPIQFHGHRNAFLHDIFRLTTSVLPESYLPMYNLEQKVERGGKIGSVLVEFSEKIIVKDVSVKTLVYNYALPVFDKNSIPGDMQNVLAQSPYIKKENLDNNCNAFHIQNIDKISLKEFNSLTVNSDLLIMDESEHIILKSPTHVFDLDHSNMTRKEEVANYFKNYFSDILVVPELNGVELQIGYQKNLDALIIKSDNPKKYNAAITAFSNYLYESNHNLKDLKTFIKKEKGNATYIFKVVFSSSNNNIIYLTDIIDNNSLISDNSINIRKMNSLLKQFNEIKYIAPVPVSFPNNKMMMHGLEKYNILIKAINELANKQADYHYLIFSKDGCRIRINNKYYRNKLQFGNLLSKYIMALKAGKSIEKDLIKSSSIDLDVKKVFIEFIKDKPLTVLLESVFFDQFMFVDAIKTIEFNNLQSYFN